MRGNRFRCMTVQIREHRAGEDLTPFFKAARKVFEGDPNWIPPLDFELKPRLDPKKGPFFERGEATFFTAWKNGEVVGRISAQVDRQHLAHYQDQTGFFGFFDTIDDDEVGQALVDAAAAWLSQRGITRMRGPCCLTMNEEIGVLVEGFDTPPAMMMNHSRSWQDKVAVSTGLTKAKDLYAWRYEVGDVPPRALKAWEDVKRMPEIRLRSIDTKRLDAELNTVLEIYNDAWKENWGYVPPTDSEAKQMVKDLKLVLDPSMAFMADLNGRPVAMCICLPNLNEAIRDFDGKLFPLNILKLLYRLKVRGPKSGRLMMLGIRSELRSIRKYAALSHALYVEVARRGQQNGYQWGELSWTLEDNKPINLGIRSMGAAIYKRYRMYEKAISR